MEFRGSDSCRIFVCCGVGVQILVAVVVCVDTIYLHMVAYGCEMCGGPGHIICFLLLTPHICIVAMRVCVECMALLETSYLAVLVDL